MHPVQARHPSGCRVHVIGDGRQHREAQARHRICAGKDADPRPEGSCRSALVSVAALLVCPQPPGWLSRSRRRGRACIGAGGDEAEQHRLARRGAVQRVLVDSPGRTCSARRDGSSAGARLLRRHREMVRDGRMVDVGEEVDTAPLCAPCRCPVSIDRAQSGSWCGAQAGGPTRTLFEAVPHYIQLMCPNLRVGAARDAGARPADKPRAGRRSDTSSNVVALGRTSTGKMKRAFSRPRPAGACPLRARIFGSRRPGFTAPRSQDPGSGPEGCSLRPSPWRDGIAGPTERL